MPSPQPLPSLFGRFTAVLQDHEHLATTLRRLRAMCAALDSGQAMLPSELVPEALLAQLHLDLSTHFRAEESSEYFGVVVEEAPGLESQIAALKWEHLTMLQTSARLREVAADRARWLYLSGPTRELVTELEGHERAEARLLRDLFFPKP